jgi:hypothetical protein
MKNRVLPLSCRALQSMVLISILLNGVPALGGLVVRYSFDQDPTGSAASATDDSGGGHGGTMSTGTVVAEPLRGNIWHGHSNGGLLINNAGMNTGTSWSVTGWHRGADWDGGYYFDWGGKRTVFTPFSSSSMVAGYGYYEGSWNQSGKAGILAANEWTHFALVVDNLSFRIYENGIQVGAGNVDQTRSLGGTGAMRFACIYYGTANVIAGDFDELRIYDHALTGDEVVETMVLSDDQDGDRMSDTWEIQYGLDPTVDDSGLDGDDDGLTNLQEFAKQCDPGNADTDNDGLFDGQEVKAGTNPLAADSDADGADDWYELNVGTDPMDSSEAPTDRDGDGMEDHWELAYGLDPDSLDGEEDLDDDRLTNLQEFLGPDGVIGGFDQSNPKKADTDGDGFTDFVEVYYHSYANYYSSTPSGLLSFTGFNLQPWLNVGKGAVKEEQSPLLPGAASYGVVNTPLANSGALLSYLNPGGMVSNLLDFRIDGVQDTRINIVVGNVKRVTTASDMQCLLMIPANGSVAYYNGGTYVVGSPAGTVVSGHTYSVRLRHETARNTYRISLLDRSDGDRELMAVSGVDLATRNKAPAERLYFGIGTQDPGSGSYNLCIDNMAVVMGDAGTGISREIIDGDADGGEDVWELEHLGRLDLLGGPNDPDGDLMDQEWEIAHFGDETHGALENPDGDLAPNWEEYLYGTDPTVKDSNVGYWRIERWYDMPYYSVHELVGDPGFYGPPSTVTTLKESGVGMEIPYSGSRIRGYVEVDETGEYYFWLSCRTAGELMLSTDATPFLKRRIAWLDPDSGTGHGVRSDSPNRWDVYASQMSEPILLEAGRKYYLEVNHQHGHGDAAHIHLAWAKVDANRLSIPRRNMSSFVALPEDSDDDSLPDAWETANGLDPTDNGSVDLERQGERGDFDGDGLNNREEYLVGTNPCAADTDGDGLSDRDELRTYGTDPTNSDSRAEELVQSVAVTSVAGLGERWIETDEGVTTASFRGAGTWDFSVPEDGFWVVEVDGRLLGNVNLSETLPVAVSIDNRSIGLDFMEFVNRAPGSLRILTPWLHAGNHDLGLFIDNYMARRTLEITAINVLRPGGLDLNGDGFADAVQNRMHALNQVSTHQIYSHVSPFFIEGSARDPQSVDLTVIHSRGNNISEKRFKWENQLPNLRERLSGYESQLIQALRYGDDRLGGEALPHQLSAGEVAWYSYVDLDRNDAIGYVAQFENHGISQSGLVVWTPYNVLDGGEMSIPAGSQVLLGAWTSDNDNKDISIIIGNEQYDFNAKESHVHRFDTPGTYTVTASHPDGPVGILTIHVKTASFGNTFETVEQTPRDWTLDDVAAELVLDGGLGGVSFTGESALPSGGTRVTVMPTWPGTHRVAARLFENGPVIATGLVNVVGYSDALRNYANTSVGVEDGIVTIRSPMLLTNLPEGGYARITIFRAGVTFQDGSTEKIITAADLDEYGVAYLYFLSQISSIGGFCHYIDIFDANGVLIRKG